MPLTYELKRNKLTVPPSFSALARPAIALGYDQLAYQIHIHNPTITEDMARAVLEAFRSEVAYQIPQGNSILLDKFISIVPTLQGNLATVTDSVNSSYLQVKAKIATPLRNEIRNAISFSKIPFQDVAPQLLAATDTNYEVQNYVRDNYGCRIDGSKMAFDATDANQGVFLLSSAGNSVRQTNISLKDPSKIIFIPALDTNAGPAGAASVEQLLSVVTKYTDNGDYRTGSYGKPLRTTNVIGLTNDQMYVVGSAATGPVTMKTWAGSANTAATFTAIIKPDQSLVMSVGPTGGVQGDQVTITDASTDVVLSGLGTDVTVTIDDYATLFASVKSYGNYMQEFVDLSATA